MATVTQQQASQSLRGQSVWVHLNSSDTLTVLPTLSVGQGCTVSSSSLTGKISFVDSRGSSFQITPTMPTGDLSSTTTPGFLNVSETITIV